MIREHADQVGKEAVEQGWAAGVNLPYESNAGEVDVIHAGKGDDHWIVELKIQGGYTEDRYWIRNTEDWRKVKAKADEMRQILLEVAEREWDGDLQIHRTGKHGMKIVVYPPAYGRPYGLRVGGMRTWRKLCREADSIIDALVDNANLTLPEGT